MVTETPTGEEKRIEATDDGYQPPYSFFGIAGSDHYHIKRKYIHTAVFFWVASLVTVIMLLTFLFMGTAPWCEGQGEGIQKDSKSIPGDDSMSH